MAAAISRGRTRRPRTSTHSFVLRVNVGSWPVDPDHERRRMGLSPKLYTARPSDVGSVPTVVAVDYKRFERPLLPFNTTSTRTQLRGLEKAKY